MQILSFFRNFSYVFTICALFSFESSALTFKSGESKSFDKPSQDNSIFVEKKSKLELNRANKELQESINFNATASPPNGWKDYGLTVGRKSDGHPVRTGESSLRIELRNGDCGNWSSSSEGWDDCSRNRERAEIGSDFELQGEHWFSYSMYVPENTKLFSRVAGSALVKATALTQFHQHSIVDGVMSSFSPPFMFNLEPIGYTMQNFVIGAHAQRPAIATADELFGKWVDILVHINATSDVDGFFRVYKNGSSTPIYSYEGAITATNQAIVIKLGIYRYGVAEDEKTPTQVVYYDNAFLEKRCEDIIADLNFDCQAIAKTETELAKTRAPKMMACDGGAICPVKYGRSKTQIVSQLSCLFKGQTAQDIPTEDQILTFADAVQDWDDFLFKPEDWYWKSAFSDATMTRHGTEMAKSLNLLLSDAEKFTCQK